MITAALSPAGTFMPKGGPARWAEDQDPELPGFDPYVDRYRPSQSARVCGQDRFKPPGEWEAVSDRFVVAGVYFRKEQVLRWADGVRRAEAGGRPYGVELIPEPANEHDRNAIKVVGHLGGRERWHIGYVPAELAASLSILHLRQGRPLIGCLYSIYQSDNDYVDINVMALTPSGAAAAELPT